MKTPPAPAPFFAAALFGSGLVQKGIVVLDRLLPRRRLVPAQRKNRRQPPRRLIRLPGAA